MTPEDINSFLISLAAGSIYFFLGLLWPKFRILAKPILRLFFGKGAFSDKLKIAHGTIFDSRLLEQDFIGARFVKRYRDGRVIGISGSYGNMMGESEIRASSYILSAISQYRSNPIQVISDQVAIKNLDATYICLGSPSSNEITELAMKEEGNKFFEFGQEGRESYIIDKKTRQKYIGFVEPNKKDYGVILKIINRRFPGHYFFICAGLGDWGTSGAAWYLANKWSTLPMARKEFGVVVEVEILSDTSARVVGISK
jgi:hypothetical protein